MVIEKLSQTDPATKLALDFSVAPLRHTNLVPHPFAFS